MYLLPAALLHCAAAGCAVRVGEEAAVRMKAVTVKVAAGSAAANHRLHLLHCVIVLCCALGLAVIVGGGCVVRVGAVRGSLS